MKGVVDMKLSRRLLQYIVSVTQVVFIVFQVLIGTFSQSVLAEAESLELNLMQDEDDGKAFITEVNHSKDQVEDKQLSISFPEGSVKVSQIKYFDPEADQDVSIPITSDQSTYQDQLTAFNNYMGSLLTYQEELITYQDHLIRYRQQQQELLQMQEDLDQLEASQAQSGQETEEAPPAEEGLEKDESESNQTGDSDQANAAIETLRGQISQLEQKMVEPAEPTDPQDDAKDKLWQIAYQEDPQKETYTISIPDHIHQAKLTWVSEKEPNKAEDLQVTAQVDYKVNGQERVEKTQVTIPAQTQASQESQDASSDTEESSSDDDSDPDQGSNPDEASDNELIQPVINDSVKVDMFQEVDPKVVVDNLDDFPDRTEFNWADQPDTNQPGETQGVLEIIYPNDQIQTFEVTLRVSSALPRPDNEGDPLPEGTSLRQAEPNESETNLSFTVEKVDINFRPLVGAGFHLRGIDENTQGYDQKISPAEGRSTFTFENLSEGNYRLEETSVPPGYNRIYDQWDVEITYNNGNVETTVNGKNAIASNGSTYIMNTRDNLNDVSFQKIDADTKEGLVGGVFELYRQLPDGSRRFVGERKTSDETGNFSFYDIPEGTYYLKEAEAPEGYVRETDWIGPYAVPNLSEDRGPYIIENTPELDESVKNLTTNFTFTKYGVTTSGTAPLPGVLFTLRDESGQPLQAEYSASNGQVGFPGLRVGEYTVTENRPQGFQRDSTPIEIKVSPERKSDGSVTLNVEAKGSDNFRFENGEYRFYNHSSRIEVRVLNLQGQPIQGARFELLNSPTRTSTSVVGTTTSDVQGNVIFDKLRPGQYYVRQASTPSPYRVDFNNDGQSLNRNIKGPYTVDANGHVDIPKGKDVIYNREGETGYITFRKVDSQTGEGIPGVTFNVRATGLLGAVWTNYGTVTTDANGYVRFPLPAILSLYYFEEVSPAPGYTNNNTRYGPWRVRGPNPAAELPKLEGNAQNVIYNDPLMMDISLTKENQNGQPIKGATFEFTKEGDPDYRQLSTSSEQGRVYASNLRPGRYKIREISPAPGYYPTDRETTFSIEQVNGRLQITNIEGNLVERDPTNPNNYRIVNKSVQYGFFKQDEEGNPIEGVRFNVTNNEGLHSDRTKYSQSDGFVSLTALSQFPNTSWTLSESEVPLGYQSTDQTWTFTVDENGIVEKVLVQGEHFFSDGNIIVGDEDQPKVLTNRRLTRDLIFYKKGINQVRLGGAEFSLQQVEPDENGNYLDVENGIKMTDQTEFIGPDNDNATPIRFERLPQGYYRIKETQTPEGYIETPYAYSIVEMRFSESTNTLTPVIVEGSLLAFDNDIGLYAPNTLDDSFGFTKYGFVPDDSAGGQVIEAIDPERSVQPLSGAVFEISGVSEGLQDYKQEVVSDGNGQVGFSEVQPGTYKIREVSVPNTYRRSNAVYQVEVTGTEQYGFQYDFKKIAGQEGDDFLVKDSNGEYIDSLAINELNPVSASFQKVSNDGEPLPGAVFSIYQYDLDTESMYGNAIAEETSDEEGMVEFTNIPPGEYAVVETRAPVNYILPDNLKGRLKITEDYQVVWDGEASSPEGYWQFDTETPKVQNDFNPIDLDFYKYDHVGGGAADQANTLSYYGRPVQGAEFTLTKYLGHPDEGAPLSTEAAERWTGISDENGHVHIDFGDYTPNRDITDDGYVYFQLEETVTPEGYQNNIPPHIIRLNRDNTFSIRPDDFGILESSNSLIINPNLGYIYFNHPLSIDLTFDKIDGHTNQKLAGSTFRVYSEETDSNGNPIYDREYTQDGTSQLYFPSLIAGTYYIEELTAPDGYALLPDPITLEVTVDENNQGLVKTLAEDTIYAEYVEVDVEGQSSPARVLEVKNYPTASFPDTGGFGPWLFYLIGFTLLLATLIIQKIIKDPTIIERGDG